MIDFYDRTGRAYAYSDDGQHIYTYSGVPIGYLADNSIYSFRGNHVGYFENGSLYDGNGNVLLFTPRSQGGPMKPMQMMKPMKAMKQMLPMKGMRQMAPMNPMKSMSWSYLNLIQVFGVE